VLPSFAFAYIGIDYAGPFEVVFETIKEKGKNDVRVTDKVYVLVITCFTTRAVHFEYVTSLTTEHFFNALQRFIARRGCPEIIHSDNGATFHKAERELKKLYTSLDWDRIQKELLQLPKPIEFKFNVPLGPHWGGVFERMVQSMKRALKATLGRRKADLEEFRTVLCNAEAVINSRPLTTVSGDPDDPLPVTPAHLSLGRALMQLPDNLGRDDVNSRIAVQWRNRQQLHSEFWTRWHKEYLVTLQSFQKWLSPSQAPRIDEIVLFEDKTKARTQWPLARIIEVHPGRDGLVRMVTIRCKGTVLRRDIRHLYRLEEALG
jgi:hypothetical protein